MGPDVYERGGLEPAPNRIPELGRGRGERATNPVKAARPGMGWLNQLHLPTATPQSRHNFVNVSVTGLALASRLEANVVELSSHRLRPLHLELKTINTGDTYASRLLPF
jgi:hypothetical protein